MGVNLQLKTSVTEALEHGGDHVALLELIRDFKASGGRQREAYETLEAIWKEKGLDANDGSGVDPLRDELEFVMEVVWGFCRTTPPIWNTTLSNE